MLDNQNKTPLAKVLCSFMSCTQFSTHLLYSHIFSLVMVFLSRSCISSVFKPYVCTYHPKKMDPFESIKGVLQILIIFNM